MLPRSGKKVDTEICQILKEFAEILVHGESVSDQFFEYETNWISYYSFFLEERMLKDIIGIIYQNRSNPTKIQVIQTISILVQNIRNEMSLCFFSFSYSFVVFILSNNHINNIITAPLDFSDEDVVSQYISFMKMLSLSINNKTIGFFLNNVELFLWFDCRRTLRTHFLCLASAHNSSTIQKEWSELLFVRLPSIVSKVFLLKPYRL